MFTLNRLDLEIQRCQLIQAPNVCMWYIVLVLGWVLEMGGFTLLHAQKSPHNIAMKT